MEAREIVIEMTEDIKACCDVYDDYDQWYDIASASVESFIEDLPEGELRELFGEFNDYVWEIENENFSRGLERAFLDAVENILDYLDGMIDEEDEDEDKNAISYMKYLKNIRNSIRDKLSEEWREETKAQREFAK